MVQHPDIYLHMPDIGNSFIYLSKGSATYYGYCMLDSSELQLSSLTS